MSLIIFFMERATKKRRRSSTKTKAHVSKTGIARQPRASSAPSTQVRGNRAVRIVRHALYGQVQVPTAAAASSFVNYNFAFKLSDMTSISDFTSLFATYKINKIKVDLVPCFVSDMFPNTSAILYAPTVMSVVLNSATNPTTAATFLQRENCVIQGLSDRRMSWTFKPFTANSGGVSAVANALEYETQPELDIASVSVYHYGLSLGFLSPPYLVSSGPDLYWNVFVTFWMTFFDPV